MLLKLAWIFILWPNKEIVQIHMGDSSRNFRILKLEQNYPAVIDLEFDGGQTVLVFKFQKRKSHLRPESLERRRLCGNSRKPRENWFVHCGPLMRPIRRRAVNLASQSGTQLFPDINAGLNFSSEMQRMLTGRTSSDPHELTIFAVRREAINYFLYKRGPINQLIRAGYGGA